MTDKVIPFGPGRRRKGQPSAQPPLPDRHKSLHYRTRQAAAGARELALQQTYADWAGYLRAVRHQKIERLIAAGKVVPARITMALNLGGHEGPDVDLAVGTWEGNPDGDVDAWEVAAATPGVEQVKLLAALTGFPIPYFYMPIEPGPLFGGTGRMWICWGGRRGCESPEPDWVDDRGVLHYGGEPPRTLPPNVQSTMF